MDYTVTSLDEIAPKVGAARAAFATGSTKPIAWRRATLERIRTLLEPRTRLVFSSGAVLTVEGENMPCRGPGRPPREWPPHLGPQHDL